MKKVTTESLSLTENEILITGATGFVGRHLSQRLPGAKKFDRRRHDFSKLETLEELVRDAKVIFHLAGKSAGSSYEISNRELVATNLEATRQLVRAIARYSRHKPRVILLSSIHVYEKSPLLSENTPIGPSAVYGAMKYSQEAILELAAEQGIIESVIFRATHLFGPGARPFYNSAVATLCCKALQGEPIDLYAQGKAPIDLLYVGDVVEYLVRAAAAESRGATQVLNLASGKTVTIGEVVGLMEGLLGRELAKKSLDGNAGPLAISTERLRETLGNFELTSLKVGLARTLQGFADAFAESFAATARQLATKRPAAAPAEISDARNAA
ncbi:MAG: NAD(P)-dependent oxidoreductase [Oligoflexia bacterium]|nr:NAD(P)-dependent oxidoreductase [Oligoflexia bacterium]